MAAELPLEISATLGSDESPLKFLIDTGSSVSILPFKSEYFSFLRPTVVSLTNASGTEVKCHGEINVNLQIPCVRRAFLFTFVVADIIQPIIGLDFLSRNGLNIDCKNKCLVDSTTNRSIPLNNAANPTVIYSLDYSETDPRAQQLLAKFPVITSPLQVSDNPVKCPVAHTIDTGKNRPIHSKARPLSGAKLKAAKEEFQFLLKAGRIRRSNSSWSSPLHLVPKKEPNEFRPCGDYRSLNNITVSDKYPVPHLRSITMSLHNKTVFSKLDMQRAYLQVPLAPEDIAKTAVCTPFGLFEYLFMPYGLKNAGATFQRYMDTLFANVPNVFVYLDDLLIASESEADHIQDLETVFTILSENNLRLTSRKCQFFQSSLTFLGYEISADGVRPPADRVSAISDMPLPETSTQLRQFMGTLNFFRQMIPNFASVAFHVTELLRLHPKSKDLPWTDDSRDSFKNLKHSLSKCPTLKYPSSEAPDYHLVTDSSNYASGGALYQLINKVPHPIGFFSKKLSQSQQIYSTYDRELLAAYLSVLQFKTLIDGHHVTLFVDHKPIVSAFYSTSIAKSDVQQRRLSLISEYVSSVQYIRGGENIVADCLSRPVCAVQVDTFDLAGLSNAQLTDPELDTYRERLTQYTCAPNINLWCDTSTQVPRPFVPSHLRQGIIKFLHNLSHPGRKTTSKLVKQRYFWPRIDSDVKEITKHCQSCQKAKVTKHTKSPVEAISAPSDRFQTIHIDIVGPLPPATLPTCPYPLPFRYALTAIDRATRWTEVIPLTDITASSVAIGFVSGWISRFGVPLEVITDRGSQFEGELFSELSAIIGFHHIRTTSYNPKANGAIERFHRTMKTAIMAREDNW